MLVLLTDLWQCVTISINLQQWSELGLVTVSLAVFTRRTTNDGQLMVSENWVGVGWSLLQDDWHIIPNKFPGGSWLVFDVVMYKSCFLFHIRKHFLAHCIVTHNPFTLESVRKPPMFFAWACHSLRYTTKSPGKCACVEPRPRASAGYRDVVAHIALWILLKVKVYLICSGKFNRISNGFYKSLLKKLHSESLSKWCFTWKTKELGHSSPYASQLFFM